MVVPDRGEHPECMFQRQRFLWKFPNILGFYKELPPFSPWPSETCKYIFSYSFTHTTLLFQRKTTLELLEICDLIFCKGRRLYLSHHREELPKPFFYFIYTCFLHLLSLCFLVSWLSSQLA